MYAKGSNLLTSAGRWLATLAFALVVPALPGCVSATIDGQAPGGPQGAAGTASASSGAGGLGSGTSGTGGAVPSGPGRVVMHRLNVGEYNNTVRDLVGSDVRLSDNFPPDDTAYGFDNIADALNISDVALGYYIDAAKKLSADALSTSKRSKLVSCDLATGKEACVGQVLDGFLPRAWRRPVTSEEKARLSALFTQNKADGATDDEALSRVLQAVLLAPEFLYRVEHNSGVAGVRPLDGYEMASRLSYFLLDSMPDAELTRAAGSGELSTEGALSAQVTRLLADAKSKSFSDSFGSQWLTIRSLDNVHPDAMEYPGFDEALRSAMHGETMRFFADIVAGQRPLRELLTSSSGYVNDRLAKHYGMPAVGSTELVFTALPANRGGLLRQASVLTVQAHPKESAPVLRGKWILSQLLCKPLPPPPPDVPQEPAEQSGQSRRERLQAHRVSPVCKSCHLNMDPLGLALEQFDGVGAYRTEENGVTIDPSGVLADGRGFATPAELSAVIAADPALPRCMAQQLFTYALGRGPRTGDSFDTASVDAMTTAFNDGGQLFPKLVSAIVQSQAFRTREDQAAP